MRMTYDWIKSRFSNIEKLEKKILNYEMKKIIRFLKENGYYNHFIKEVNREYSNKYTLFNSFCTMSEEYDSFDERTLLEKVMLVSMVMTLMDVCSIYYFSRLEGCLENSITIPKYDKWFYNKFYSFIYTAFLKKTMLFSDYEKLMSIKIWEK